MIDLNTATAEAFAGVGGLRGHGFEVVRCREERGRFTSLRQLAAAPGPAGKSDGIGAQVSVEAG